MANKRFHLKFLSDKLNKKLILQNYDFRYMVLDINV